MRPVKHPSHTKEATRSRYIKNGDRWRQGRIDRRVEDLLLANPKIMRMRKQIYKASDLKRILMT